MHKTLSVIALLLALGLGGCKSRGMSSKKLDSATRTNAATWKSDPMGCKGQRTDPMGAALAENLKQAKLTAKEVMELLGDPEFTQTRNAYRVLGYYYNGDCLEGEIPDGAVYCVLEFFFEPETGALEEAGVVCG